VTVWATTEDGLDWQLVQNGFTTSFYSRDILSEAVRWLAHRGYDIAMFNAAGWDTKGSSAP